MGRLENKTAIVTGGAGGIGKEAGRLFAAEGANVLLVDRDGAALQQAVREIGSSRVASCVADAESTRDYVRAAVDRFGGIDILLANAGIEGKVLPITECDEDTFDRVIAVNVRGAARMSPYITSKHAVVGLMKPAALEGAPLQL